MEPRLDFFAPNPLAMKALLGLDQVIARGTLEPALVELVRLRASQINGCAFCMDRHADTARKGGEQERRLTLLAAWRETQLFSDRERAALAWTEALTLVAETHVPNEVWHSVHPHFTASELVDLTLLVSAINAWNRFAIAFRRLPA
ncbi:MAG TPA: carboxymuconolactone decarboxylase family protein [Geothrix sp.]|nr:carboxymuconolactone decarboxylase family protein [Geothrix sp.]